MDPGPTRRSVLASGALALGGVVSGCSRDQSQTPPPADEVGVGLDVVVEGFAAPIAYEVPTGTDRRYVADQTGQIYAIGSDQSLALDVTDRMVSLGGGYTERGLLGLALHPDFPEDPRAFVRYSAPTRPETPAGYSHTFVLSSFRASTADRFDPDSERILLELPQPQSNHNAGSIVFGPDGLLYVGVGDGGGGGDRGRGHVSDWYDPLPGGNGQDVTANLLGSLLRIDVDDQEPGRPYAIPAENPLVGREGLAEQYAWGFRNPWRLSFDRDRLLVADVGQSRYEEVNRVEVGGNYGWNIREGPACYQADTCPTETDTGEPLVDPVVSYPHSRNGTALGRAVVGGFVYRGRRLRGLRGRYVFGDWSRSFASPSGTLFVATPAEAGPWEMARLPVAGTENGGLGRYLLAFGRDRRGELYVCTNGTGAPTGTSGAVSKLVPPET